MVTDWAEKQAEVIVDAFLADEEPEDLLRLVQSIAKALRLACKRGSPRGKPGVRGTSSKMDKGRKSPSRNRLK